MRARVWRYAGAAAALTVVLTCTSSTASSFGWAPTPWWGHGRVDLVSSAQPSEAAPKDRDDATRIVWLRGPGARADAVATSSADCAGCRGEARTVQVVWAGRSPGLRVDNVATAWASCTDCGATAISVQLVLTRHPGGLTANNRALAVNGACTRCTTSAAAYQVVLVTRHWVDLDELREQLRAWVRDHPAGPGPAVSQRSATTPRAAQGAGPRLRDLAGLIAEQTHGHVVRKAVEVRTGP